MSGKDTEGGPVPPPLPFHSKALSLSPKQPTWLACPFQIPSFYTQRLIIINNQTIITKKK